MSSRSHQLLGVARVLAFLVLAASARLGLSAGLRRPSPTPTPRLVVVVVVDQLRADVFERMWPHLPGGLGRIGRESVRFTEAFHDHAITSTAPGHATLATGLYPAHHGLIDNGWWDRDKGKQMYCVEDSQAAIVVPGERPVKSDTAGGSSSGRSAANLRGTGLGDWIEAAEPTARAWSIGGKDRSAILLGGKSPRGVVWYDPKSKGWVTSKAYAKEVPVWLERLAARSPSSRHFGTAWEPLPKTLALAAIFGARKLELGDLHRDFPHLIGGLDFTPSSEYYEELAATPMLEEDQVDVALAVIAAEELGGRGVLDYLALASSTFDYVGHEYGPQSLESLDALLRIDAALGRLFAALDVRLGPQGWAAALSSDHGVLEFPELVREGEAPAHRLDAVDALCFQRASDAVVARFGPGRWLASDLYLDFATIGKADARRSEVEAVLAEALGRCPAVARVWRRGELLRPPEPGEVVADEPSHRLLYARSYDPDRSPDLAIELRERYLDRLFWGTTHGSAHLYDRHVPMALRLPDLAPTAISSRVATVDFAPTLAAALGVDVPAAVDGVDRSPLLGRVAPRAKRR